MNASLRQSRLSSFYVLLDKIFSNFEAPSGGSLHLVDVQKKQFFLFLMCYCRALVTDKLVAPWRGRESRTYAAWRVAANPSDFLPPEALRLKYLRCNDAEG